MSEKDAPDELPIVNCHTHIFTRNHVPPFLAKSFVFWPIYYIINTHAITWLIKTILDFIEKQRYVNSSLYNRFIRLIDRLQKFMATKVLLVLITIWLSVQALVICMCFLLEVSPLRKEPAKILKLVIDFLTDLFYLIEQRNTLLDILIVLIVFILIPNSRKLIFTILKLFWKFLGAIPGKGSFELAERYLMLGRFAINKNQSTVFSKLKAQYPPKTRFIVLPMDMHFMKAGPIPARGRYREQMEELIEIKKTRNGKFMEPFVFIDPRRIRHDKGFLRYHIEGDSVKLDRCAVKRYIEDEGFSGFKIYPALGYYPFDEDLLPLWKYAADHQIPIMSHVIRGTIFYRGRKKKEWNHHPIFMQPDGKGGNNPLELLEKKNVDFSVNFTHPLNFLCLLSEPLLRILLKTCRQEIRDLFGFKDVDTPLRSNLSHLKVCMAHFGGEPEWVKYLEMDRFVDAQKLIQRRSQGLPFISGNKVPSVKEWNRLHRYWKHTDWYSIICSLMLSYDNMYADISYILSKPRIFPLLNETLDPVLNPKLHKRVLFGTDFYVVRNHFSEKDLLTQIKAGISDQQFDQIARVNPHAYLKKIKD